MKSIRFIVLFIGICLLLSSVSLMWGIWSPWHTSFLLGSTLFAYSIAALWIGIVQSYHALIGGGLSLVVTCGGASIYMLRLGAFWYGQAFLYLAILALWIFFFGLNLPRKREDFLPVSVRILFGILMTLALLEGIYLIIPLPYRFAWLLHPEQSIIFGWMLIGGSVFLGWNLLRPTWENGYPALYALFAYDVLLIGPVFSLLINPKSVVVIPFYLWMFFIVVVASGIWSAATLYKRICRR